MLDEITYHFKKIHACPMCGADTSKARVLGLRLNQSQGLKPRAKTGISVTICQCSDCRLLFPQPLPIPSRIEDHYGVPPEDYWSSHRFDDDPDYFQQQVATAKRLLDFKLKMNALDIGAGLGKAMVALERAGFEVYGIEPSQSFREAALKRTGLPPERIQCEMLEEADFPANHFDFITFGAVLEHLYDPGHAIETALQWLKPGGVIQIEVPSSNWLIEKIVNAAYRTLGTNFVSNLSPMHSPYHLYAFTRRSFEKHGQRVGYTITESYVEVCTLYHVPKLMQPLLRKWMKVRDTGMQLTVWLRK
ncbi:MAG: class I SAM-dependent methyltransferase [Erythrobacter sp.]